MQVILIALVVACIACIADGFRAATGRATHPRVALHGRSSLRMNGGDSQALISIARDFVSSGFGVADPTLISDERFSCTGQLFKLTSKDKYVSGLAKETSAFRRAMPDFEFRPYDFEVDPANPSTVWFKIRPKGTLTGPFSFKGEVYLPNKAEVELPLQLCSVSIDKSKVTRVTAGYVMDRFTGNTGGYPGPFGVLYALGYAPNKFTFFPPAAVVRQFFGRTRKPISKKVGVSPFPETVMISLAKAMLDSSLGASDPSLLADSFTFSGPIVGPLPKGEFVKAFSSFNLKKALPDLDPGAVSFKVDAYEPDRVWIIARGTGTQTGPLEIGGRVLKPPSGAKYQGPPEAVSVSFEESGKCYKATAGYVIDREQGNTAGLGGVFGLLEAIGVPLPWWEKQSIPQVIISLKESLFPTPAPAPAPVKAVAKPEAPAPKPVAAPVKAAPKPQAPAPAPKPVAAAPKPVVAPVKAVAKPPVPAPAVKPPAAPAKKQGGFFDFLGGSGEDFFDSDGPAKPVAKAPSAPAPKAAAVKAPPAPAPKPVVKAPASAPKPVVKPPPAPAPKATPVASAKKQGGLFDFFGGSGESFFDSDGPAKPDAKPSSGPALKAPVKAPAPNAAPAAPAAPAKKQGGFFDFLGGSSKDVIDSDGPAKPVAKAPSAPAPKAAVKAPSAAAPKAAAVKAPAPKAAPAAPAAPAKKQGGFFDFLGGSSKDNDGPNKPVAKPTAAAPKAAAPAPVAAKTAPPKVDTAAEAAKKAAEQKRVAASAAAAAAAAAAKTKAEADAKAKAVAAAASASAAAAKTKLQLQEEAMRKYQALEEAKKAPVPAAPAAKVAPSPAPKAPASAPAPAPAAAPKAAAPVQVTSTTLSASAVKALSGRGASAQQIADVGSAVGKFAAGSAGPETVFSTVKQAVGRDGAFDVFPDIIGSVPRGERKSQLNAWFQSQA